MAKRVATRSPRQGFMQKLSSENGLMPWHEVTARWNAMSGQPISRNRVWQIAQRAEQKIAEALRAEAGGRHA